jgi:hypothetical protein
LGGWGLGFWPNPKNPNPQSPIPIMIDENRFYNLIIN